MTDKQVAKFVLKFRSGILGGESSKSKCFAVCWPLTTLLSMCGIVNEIKHCLIKRGRATWGHVVLELSDGRIIDPTADQFSTAGRPMPEVYLGPWPTWYKRCAPSADNFFFKH
jgi:hypothetical protein